MLAFQILNDTYFLSVYECVSISIQISDITMQMIIHMIMKIDNKYV